MRVMLIQPPYALFENDKRQAMPPLGLAYIAAVLEREGYEVSIVDCVVEGFEHVVPLADGRRRVGLNDDELRKRIEDDQPHVVGVSCLFSSQSSMAHDVCELVKQVDSGIFTVMGGAHPSAVPTEVLTHPDVDAVVIGEGEQVLLRLVQSLERGQFPPADRSGLC